MLVYQRVGIWSTRWLLFSVMSNIPKMGQLPTPGVDNRTTANSPLWISKWIFILHICNLWCWNMHTNMSTPYTIHGADGLYEQWILQY